MNTLKKHVVIFDGECGFCHRWVRLFIRFDSEFKFYFCPRQSVENGVELREKIGESITVYTSSGEVLGYSDAVIFILKELAGLPRYFGVILMCVPKSLRDMGYTCIATIRHRLSTKPPTICPIVPEEKRTRFLEHLPAVPIRHTS